MVFDRKLQRNNTFSELSSNDENCDFSEIDEEFQSIYAATRQNDDNWSLKRRTDDGETNSIVSSSMTPIAMLVPAPTDDIRTRIGDRNADEISDLSDAEGENSDLDDSLEMHIENKSNELKNLPHVLNESKHLMGEYIEESNKNDLNELLQPGSLVSDQSVTNQTTPAISEAKNEWILIESPTKNVSNTVIAEANKKNDETNLMDFDFVPISR